MSPGLCSQELQKEAKSHKALLDSLNEVSAALLELVPWRAREGLERTVAEDNDRFRLVSDSVAQRVEAIDAALLRAQQVGGRVPPGACPPSGLSTHRSHSERQEGLRRVSGLARASVRWVGPGSASWAAVCPLVSGLAPRRPAEGAAPLPRSPHRRPFVSTCAGCSC